MITRGWRSVPTCDCGMDLRDHPAECIDPLTDPQAWWSPRKGASVKGKNQPEEPKDTETRIQEKALKDGEAATDRLIQDLKDMDE